MANNPTGNAQPERTYTYPEYKEHFHRSTPKDKEPKEEREPSEVGKEMARAIIEQLRSHTG